MRYMTEEEKRNTIKKLECSYKRHYLKSKILNRTKIILFTLIKMIFSVVALVSKFLGYIFSIGMLYGIYNLYRIVVIWNGKMSSIEGELRYVGLFLFLPFIAYIIHFVCKKTCEYLEENLGI